LYSRYEDRGVHVSQILTLDKSELRDRVGKLSRAKLELLLPAIDVVLGR